MKGLSDRVALMCYMWSHTPCGNVIGDTTEGQPVRMLRSGEAVAGRGSVTMRGAEIEIGAGILRGSVVIMDDDTKWGMLSMAERESVVLIAAAETGSGRQLSTSGGIVECMRYAPPQDKERRYRDLAVSGADYICPEILGTMAPPQLASVKTRLLVERLSDKCARLDELRRLAGGSDSDMAVAALLDSVMISNPENRKLFGELGTIIGHNRIISSLITGDRESDKVSVEALLFGSAGFISEAAVSSADDYVYRLREIFDRLRKGHRLTPISYVRWNRGSRRDNTPALLIAQTAAILADGKPLYHRLCECRTIDDLRNLFREAPSEYWRDHFALGRACEAVSTGHMITGDKIDRILINFMLPFLFDRLRNTEGEECAAEVVDMFEGIEGERNNIVNRYDTHTSVRTSFDSQALIQLYKCYCRQNRCWQCPVGARYMSAR